MMNPPAPALETTIAGSLPKPSWLAKPQALWAPWQLAGEQLAEAKRDAVRAALKMQEAAGIDIVGDGEQSRTHFVHGFLQGIEGVDFGRMKRIGIRAERYEAECPTVTGAVRRPRPVHAEDARFARANTARKLKFTLPGPIRWRTPSPTSITAIARSSPSRWPNCSTQKQGNSRRSAWT